MSNINLELLINDLSGIWINHLSGLNDASGLNNGPGLNDASGLNDLNDASGNTSSIWINGVNNKITELHLVNNIVKSICNIINKDINKIKTYNIDTILKLNSTSVLILLELLTKIILSNVNYSYKYSFYEPLIYLIVTIIINYKKKNILDLEYNNKNIINTISIVNNSQFYLKQLKNIIEYNKLTSFSIACNVSLKGTLPGFLFWWEYYKDTVISNDDYNILLSNSIVNPDDRLFKFIINIKNVELINIFYDNYSKPILVNLLQSNIPNKFKLKRIKLLSSKTDLSKHLKSMIEFCSLNILNKLMKYYYKTELDFNTISLIFTNSSLNFLESFQFYKILKTLDEKNMFALLCNLHGFFNIKIKIYGNNYTMLNTHYVYIISQIEKNIKMVIEENNSSINSIFRYYINIGYINKYLSIHSIHISEMFKYSKFYTSQVISSYNIKINRILHFLRCIIKKKYRIKDELFKFNFKPILNEITNFRPNLKVRILQNGSTNYQLKEQLFNNIPPRHLLPYENINKPFLIKEKADGLLLKTLPTITFPHVSEIFNYEIKSEFIEELNLYLVFDINIPDKTIYERQVILRNLHYVTNNKSTIPNINNFEQFKDELLKERALLNNFIILNKEKIKWYPKGSWKINIDNDNYQEVIKIITEDSIYQNIILNGIFNCDGLILTPLDGSRELKVKPKSLQTIDLFFDGKKWIDSNNHKWDVEIEKTKKYKNKIYRCYPIINNKHNLLYVPKEIRYDKKKANSYQIIDQIQNIFKFDWNLNKQLSEKYYQEKKIITNNEIIKIIKRNDDILYDQINFIKPNLNKNWLDLGCGNCKLFKNIKNKYYPKKYLGIDNDIDILSNLYNIVDENNENFNIYPANLDKVWDKNNIWNSFDWTIKYDYIIANFSLMHFCSTIFWLQLNNVTDKNSKFIFNVVKSNSTWINNMSFLKSDDKQTTINFDWVHTNPITEELITEEMINNYISKFNWKIIKTTQSEEPLSECYKWYILEKIL